MNNSLQVSVAAIIIRNDRAQTEKKEHKRNKGKKQTGWKLLTMNSSH